MIKLQRWIELLALISLLLLYGLSAYQRNLVWKDDVALWSDVVKKSPEKARPRNNLGVGFNKKGLPHEAISSLKEALRLKPGYMDAYVNLGNSYIKIGIIDEAISAYIEALTLKPDDVNAQINLAGAYGTKGLLDKAIYILKRLVEAEPHEPLAHYNLGIAYNLKGLKELAVMELKEVIRLEPGNIRALYYLGEIELYDMGDRESALFYYERLLSIDPEHHYAPKARGRIKEIRGK